MHVHTSLETWRTWRNGLAVPPVFVPTMGNLHQGHLSLVRQAQAIASTTGAPVVVSIFVNRLQFAPHEDFDSYPRTLAQDVQLLESVGCDALFAPTEADLYPQPQTFKLVPPPELADILEGAFRPGFFTGVCTVVHKLFNIIGPQAAVFGKKDYQQLMVIRHMVAQMGLPMDIHGVDTLRADDDLALSSRNGYLSELERTDATHLVKTLRQLIAQAQSQVSPLPEGDRGHLLLALQQQAQQALAASGWEPDYVEVRRQQDLGVPSPQDLFPGAALVVLAAARLGQTRLIDNLEFRL